MGNSAMGTNVVFLWIPMGVFFYKHDFFLLYMFMALLCS